MKDENGKIYLGILDECLNDIEKVSQNRDTIFLIRSTTIPGTTRKLSESYPNLKLVFNPEFLTERSTNFDFINQSRVILGGDTDNVNKGLHRIIQTEVWTITISYQNRL